MDKVLKLLQMLPQMSYENRDIIPSAFQLVDTVPHYPCHCCRSREEPFTSYLVLAKFYASGTVRWTI